MATNKPIVNKIEAKPDLMFSKNGEHITKKRVAAYARVSTENEEQQSSYEAQVDFYTRYIKANPEWDFVGIYSDEGISGTNTKNRDGFNSMIADALNGKIDLLLTKSISRFARNTVDTLSTIRQLKAKNIEVYFEKENIYTLDAKGEVMLTIMSSLAQEESRSISENVTWGKRKSMEDGKIYLPYASFLGYKQGEDGLPEIVPEEAKIIRLIYAMFLEGKTIRTIADYLTNQGIPTPSERSKTNIWGVSTVKSILTNEKYKGDALLQKTYTVDFLNKTKKKNNGELPQYYVKNSHPAIIDPEVFDLVQSEMKKRKSVMRRLNNSSIFSARIICGDCGGYYGSKVLHSNDKYKVRLWFCNHKYTNAEKCITPKLKEEEIKAGFVYAVNSILGNKQAYIKEFEELLPILADASSLSRELELAKEERENIVVRLQKMIEQNAKAAQNQAEYTEKYSRLENEYNLIEEKIKNLQNKILEQTSRKEKIRLFLDSLKKSGDIVTEFNDELWCSLIENVAVSKDEVLEYRFKGGIAVPIKLSEIKVQ